MTKFSGDRQKRVLYGLDEKQMMSELEEFNTRKIPTNEYSPLVLAYIGDAVYEVYIRMFLAGKANMPVHRLHRQATQYVKAKAQSDMVEIMIKHLTEQELRIYKRGRNAKSGKVPKNADVQDYRRATGFEALIGYLYLERKMSRIVELLDMVVLSYAQQ